MGALLHDLRMSAGLGPAEVAALLAGLWLVLVPGLSALLPIPARRWCLAPALASGVPILGLLTYSWGPEIGLLALVAGLLALVFLLRGLSYPEG